MHSDTALTCHRGGRLDNDLNLEGLARSVSRAGTASNKISKLQRVAKAERLDGGCNAVGPAVAPSSYCSNVIHKLDNGTTLGNLVGNRAVCRENNVPERGSPLALVKTTGELFIRGLVLASLKVLLVNLLSMQSHSVVHWVHRRNAIFGDFIHVLIGGIKRDVDSISRICEATIACHQIFSPEVNVHCDGMCGCTQELGLCRNELTDVHWSMEGSL
mmetsp:Transcript_9385/g.18570  ORF Transcript_9385/g.18570 Transcript_9385/m.18570 type:complete len:216 (+) Transcript_9385:286-933(+)